MERFAWRAKVLDGKLEEYQKRHDEIWPELLVVLKKAGISNYSIWNNGNDLFGYFECDKGISFAAEVQASSSVVEQWNEYMKSVMLMELDPVTGAQPLMKNMFYMK
jgi:L-rhamnose mutarotase